MDTIPVAAAPTLTMYDMLYTVIEMVGITLMFVAIIVCLYKVYSWYSTSSTKEVVETLDAPKQVELDKLTEDSLEDLFHDDKVVEETPEPKIVELIEVVETPKTPEPKVVKLNEVDKKTVTFNEECLIISETSEDNSIKLETIREMSDEDNMSSTSSDSSVNCTSPEEESDTVKTTDAIYENLRAINTKKKRSTLRRC